MVMLRITLKGLWAHKLRFLLTGLAVVLGVAFMSGTMVLTDTMSATFDDLLAETNEGIDAVVRQGTAIEGEFVEARERVDASVLETVRDVDGVAAAYGSVEGFTQLVRSNGEVATSDGFGATIGANWIDDERLNPFVLVSGRAPDGPGEVVIDRASAKAEQWTVGDTIVVLAKDGPEELTIVGEASYGAVEGVPGSTLLATDTETAQRLFGEPGTFDDIVVAKDAGVSSDELAASLQSALAGQGLEAMTGAADTADQQADLREDLSFFNTFLLSFAYISLFVGMFIIYNTFSIVIAQRTRDLAMLRAIGASRRQVLRSVLAEATAVGITACAIGLGLGVAMSYGLRALLAGVGLDIPSGATVVSSATVITSVVVGMAITLLSAALPAIRASNVPPIAALRDVAIDRSHLALRRVIAGLGLTGAGVALVAAGLTAESGGLQVLGLGAVTTVLGVFVLGPVIARPALRVLGLPARVVSGPVGHLARENARRNPKRTSATAAALMVGVALVGFITILASSTTAAVGRQVDESFRADYVVDSGQFGTAGLSPALGERLAAMPEVDASSPLRMAPVAVAGETTEIAGVDTAVFEQLFDVKPVEGSLADVAAGTIAVKSSAATEMGLAVGESVSVTFARTGAVELQVAAIFEDSISGAGDTDWIVGLDTFSANVTDQYDRKLFVSTVDGLDTDSARTAIDVVLADWPNAELQDQAAFKTSITSEIERLLNLIYGLLALAVIIALIGIANTLALSVHERTRELGLLRAVGMIRSQVRSLVRWEAVMIAVLGTGLGLGLAVAGAWAIIQALADEGVTEMVMPGVRLALIVGFASLAGVAAALGPARRAARIDVLRAISSE
jgi:putative ABC transport system permease protein